MGNDLDGLRRKTWRGLLMDLVLGAWVGGFLLDWVGEYYQTGRLI